MGQVAPQICEDYLPLYISPKRYFLITGGRGSLKSSTVHDFIARLTYEQGHGVLFTRYTMTSAEKSIIPEFLITLNRLGIANDFDITKNIITNKHTGSFIYFSGIKTQAGDQTANLKSIAGITTWVIEEGEDFKDEKAFDAIDDSIRTASIQNRVIWIQNPTTRDHFVYTRFIEPANRKISIDGYDVTVSALPEVEHIHTTFLLGEKLGYLSSDWLAKAYKYRREAQAAEDKYSTWYYHNYIGGWLERAEGAIFTNWREGEFDTTLPYLFGLDFGFSPDPTALIKVAVDERNKLIYGEQRVYKTELSTDGVVTHVYDYIDRITDLIEADHDKRMVSELRKKGMNVSFAIKGRVADDIRDMQDYTLVVHPDSNHLKKELNSYVWNDKKASIPIDAHNHLIDGWRYGFRRLVGGPRRGARRWNH